MSKKRSLSFKASVMIFLVLILLFMGIISIFSIRSMQTNYASFSIKLQSLSDVRRVKEYIDGCYDNILSYTLSGNPEYITTYTKTIERVKQYLLEEEQKYNSGNNIKYDYQDLYNVLLTFDETSLEIASDYDENIESIFVANKLTYLKRLTVYFDNELNDIIDLQLISVNELYEDLGDSATKKERNVYYLSVALIIVCLAVAFIFIQRLTHPLNILVKKLSKVADGDYDVGAVDVNAHGEMRTLVDVYNFMIMRLKQNIDAIKEKIKLERMLKEEQVKNLEVSNLLKESELNALQSQINPHFLFNTLNSIGALADIEQAGATKQMLTNFSDLLRYNLKRMNSIVTIKDEIDIIEKYVYIQRVRFGKRIEYVLDIDERALDVKIPSLVLQPFVENSIIHGLEAKTENGILKCTVKKQENTIEISIEDNGVGMSKVKLEEIMAQKDSKEGSIGISNVIKRLELFYGKNVVHIESELGQGTNVRISLVI